MSPAIVEPVDESRETESSGRRLALRPWAWATVAIYWLGMFGGTHWPKPPHSAFGTVDKWMHFSAYGGLAVLLSLAMSLGRPFSLARSLANLLGILLLLAGYGALDELTQPLVQRDCDIWDWCADMIGALLGTSLFLLVAYAVRRRSSESE